MIKRKLILTLAFLIVLQLVTAISTPAGDVYLDVNRTYPLTLIPLDDNVWNITLNVYEGNWTEFNWTWNGSIYGLAIAFNTIGDYPFVINSTEVEGSIIGTFLVREPFNVTFKFIKRTESYLFFSNKYINNYAYVTAEPLTNIRKYDANIEPFFAELPLTSRQQPKVFWATYTNGEATLKLYDKTNYAIRLIDGIITFENEYSVPNITQNYEVNAYIGNYNLNSTLSFEILLKTKTLKPITWGLNIALIGLVVLALFSAIVVLFVAPQVPMISITLGLAFPVILIILRIILYIAWA